MINFKEMMQQAQQMQFKLAELQEKFVDIEVEGEAGNGLVKVRMNCKGETLAIDIHPSLLEDADKEMLEDMILAAINNANAAKEQRIQDETRAMMSEMGLPQDTKLPMN